MVDNFDQISEYIKPDEDEFYYIQIIRRAKDNPQIGSNNQWVKAYNITSRNDLLEKRIRITDLCNKLGARAYIHLSPRNSHIIALMMLEELAAIMRTEQYPNARNLYATMCGRYMPPKGKKLWIVDIDRDQYEHIDTIVDDLRCCLPVGDKVRYYIPTKSGIHLITTPFDLQTFTSMYPNIDVHRNNPTLLYCP